MRISRLQDTVHRREASALSCCLSVTCKSSPATLLFASADVSRGELRLQKGELKQYKM